MSSERDVTRVARVTIKEKVAQWNTEAFGQLCAGQVGQGRWKHKGAPSLHSEQVGALT